MTLSTYLAEACFVFYSIGTAYIQARIFNDRAAAGNPATINHSAWGWAYFVYSVIVILAMHGSLVFGLIAAGLIREVFFAPALNLWRKFPADRDFFYFDPKGKSMFDRIIKTRKRYIAVYAVSVMLLILVQILIQTK